MKKKSLIAILTAALLLTGCSGGNSGSSDAQSGGSQPNASQTTGASAKTAAEKAAAPALLISRKKQVPVDVAAHMDLLLVGRS